MNWLPYRPEFLWLTLAVLALTATLATALLLALARVLARALSNAVLRRVWGATLAALLGSVLRLDGHASQAAGEADG